MSAAHLDRVRAALDGFYRRVDAGLVPEPKAPRTKRPTDTPSEHDEQRRLVSWLRSNRIPLVAPINGSRLSGGDRDRATQWGKLVSLGASAGVPDLILGPPPPAQPDKRVAVEMKKASGGTVSPAQREWHTALTACGWIVLVAHGADDAIEHLRRLGYGGTDVRR